MRTQRFSTISVDNSQKTVDNLLELGKTRKFDRKINFHYPPYMGVYFIECQNMTESKNLLI